MLLHPRRAVVLHALALVAGSREPLDRGFAAVAAGDRLLQRWVPRLCPPLAAGEALAAVLRRHRLVGAAEAELIASDRDTADTLRRVASGAIGPPPGALLARWFPTCLAFTLGLGCVTGSAVAIIWLGQMYRDLNIRLPLGLGSWVSWAGLAGAALGIACGIWFIEWCMRLPVQRGKDWQPADGTPAFQAWMMRWCPAPADHQVLWAPDACQAGAMHECLLALRLGKEAEAYTHWDVWWSLARWRLPTAIRHGLGSEPTLERRLMGLGALASTPAGPDWSAACTGSHQTWAEALAREAPLLRTALMIGFLLSAIGSMMAPLLAVITQLNGGG